MRRGPESPSAERPTRVVAAIGLGANLGDPAATLRSAFDALAGEFDLLARSSLFETEPVGGPEGQPMYVNAAALVRTTRTARALLGRLQAIERNHGRDRTKEPRWGPRTLDLDLLTYGDARISEPGLRVPHPRMGERRFVLAPLAEIAPGLVPGDDGTTVRELLEALT